MAHKNAHSFPDNAPFVHVSFRNMLEIEMSEKAMTTEDVIREFGVDPTSVGHRNRGWWIVGDVDDEEMNGNAWMGDLCVRTRDGGSNPIDVDAFKIGHYIGSSEDGFDRTYRYYYYRSLAANSENGEG